MIENGGKQKAIIPKSLAPGEYLVRFDFIALHMGGSVWSPGSEAGSQWYPRCAQIKVTGNGNVKLPSGVAIPGLYTKDTPGVVQDIFSNPGKAGKNYIVPGKQIAVLFSKYYGFDADYLGPNDQKVPETGMEPVTTPSLSVTKLYRVSQLLVSVKEDQRRGVKLLNRKLSPTCRLPLDSANMYILSIDPRKSLQLVTVVTTATVTTKPRSFRISPRRSWSSLFLP